MDTHDPPCRCVQPDRCLARRGLPVFFAARCCLPFPGCVRSAGKGLRPPSFPSLPALLLGCSAIRTGTIGVYGDPPRGLRQFQPRCRAPKLQGQACTCRAASERIQLQAVFWLDAKHASCLFSTTRLSKSAGCTHTLLSCPPNTGPRRRIALQPSFAWLWGGPGPANFEQKTNHCGGAF